MWPWRRKAKRKTIFWSKIYIFTSVLHLVVLLFLFFLYKGDNFVFNVTVNSSIMSSEVDIIYLPLKKTVASPVKITKKNNRKISTPKQKVKPKPKPKKVTTIAKKKPVKKSIVKKQPVASKKNKVAKKVEKKKTKVTQNINMAKQVEKITRKEHIAQDKIATANQPIYLGRNDLEALRLQDAIQVEVEKCWRPPAGFSKDLCCVIKVLVGWNGKVKRVTVVKSSGVLPYDVSARMAVCKLQMPSAAKGKEVNITFNQ